jgi:putative membrane protein
MEKSHKIVYGIYIFVWIVMAINPKYPQDWLLENILVFIFFPFIYWMDNKHHYTLLSLILVLIFASLHALGSHYTYAQMEHFDIITQFFGFERNHFDRLVHFASGLLLFRLIFEMSTEGIASVNKALVYTSMMIITIATLYELLEWLVVILFHPELGGAFLGTQGDIWDAQQDIFAALIGIAVNLFFYRSYQKLHQERNSLNLEKERA